METNENDSVTMGDTNDVTVLAKSFTAYKIAEAINKTYFPVFVPLGVVGNILSFLVMIQKRNREMSFSLYISVLAIADNVAVLIGFSRYLNSVHDVNMPPTQFWYCSLSTTVLWVANLCSTLFILNMTFEHFYSIIRPHKAASFNTVKRTKLSIACSVIFSILYNILHLYITFSEGRRCGPFGRAMKTNIEQFYYWFSLFINFALPFVLLLIMNCFIIHTIRQRPNIINTRSQSTLQGQGQSEGQGQASKIKSSEMQIFIILLLVTFGFLFLTTPAYVWFVYINFGNLLKSPKTYAGYRLFHSVAQKLYYTNYGINFYLYVISGKKFRGDLVELFVRNKTRQNYMAKSVKTENSTSLYSIDNA